MKKIVLFLAMALLITSLSAQTVKELKTLDQTVSINGIISQQAGEYVKSVKKTDEEIWVKDSTYSYKANGDEWKLYTKSIIEQRDEYGNPVVEKTYLYDAGKELWEPTYSFHMKWHAFEVQAEEVLFVWNSSEKTWSDTVRHVEYNENGKLLSSTARSWDYDRDAYKAFSYEKSTFIYDSTNLLIEQNTFRETRTGEAWKKHLFQYDENGNIIEDLSLYLDDEDWSNSGRKTYTYNENGLLNTKKTFWADGSGWYLTDDLNYEYDANGNNSLIEAISIDLFDSTSIKKRKIETLFDSNNNRTKITTSSWDGNIWNIEFESYYYYNDENGVLDSVSSFSLNNFTQKLEKSPHEDYFWSPFSNENISINDPQEINISLSPNPVTSLLQINTKVALTSNIEIYSMQGQLIKSILPEKSLTIDCSGLNSGIYFVKCNTSKGIVTKKILKQ